MLLKQQLFMIKIAKIIPDRALKEWFGYKEESDLKI